MPLISRYDKSTIPWRRTTGIYGHWPRNGYKGYICVITKTHGYNFWYGMKNPFRPGKIIERYPIISWRKPRYKIVPLDRPVRS